MTKFKVNAGSYRDPSGQIYEDDSRVLRAIYNFGREDYEVARDSKVIEEAITQGFLIESFELQSTLWPEGLARSVYVIEHPRIPYISYPYEWSFTQLKLAALHHIDFQIFLLDRGFKLKDASAYNIQFIGREPIFIDLLSIAPYRNGEYWVGHRQFCEQFLNPLLLRSKLGIAHNEWYRGALEGISSISISAMLPMQKKLSWGIFSHVVLPASFERKALNSPESSIRKVKGSKGFSKMAYMGFLSQLKSLIKSLYPMGMDRTAWSDYADNNNYSNAERDIKRDFIKRFISSVRPKCLIDLGCNTGDYSVAALEAGADYVIGFDFDQQALDLAWARCYDRNKEVKRFLPLWLDASNPSPSQGWRHLERLSFEARASSMDAVIALAFEHHLAIAKNIPLAQVVEWLVSLAPQGIIEFVPKSDTTVQKMLALREDIFLDYSLSAFEVALEHCATIVDRQNISESGRVLFWFCKK